MSHLSQLLRAVQSKTPIKDKKKILKSTFETSRGNMEPSPKWKSLGLTGTTDEIFYTAPQSPPKSRLDRVFQRVGLHELT